MLRTSSLPELPVSACCSGLYICCFLDEVVDWLPVPAVATASISPSFLSFSAMASFRSFNVSAEYPSVYTLPCSIGTAISSEPACYSGIIKP